MDPQLSTLDIYFNIIFYLAWLYTSNYELSS